MNKKIIYCDGGMNKYTKPEAWGSVVDDDGKDLIESNLKILSDMNIVQKQLKKDIRFIIISKFNDVATQQNNGAELLSLVAALRIALNSKDITKICTDSSLIYTYWSKGQVNKDTLKKMDTNKKNLIFECKDLREEFEKNGGIIEKIKGDDNKADLGWH